MAPRSSAIATGTALAGAALLAAPAFVPSAGRPGAPVSQASTGLRGAAREGAPGNAAGLHGLVSAASVAAAVAVSRRVALRAEPVSAAGKSVKGNEPSASFDPSGEVGAMPPLGYFNPAGFCKKGGRPSFRNMRAAEIKHGRVAMMAAVGAVVQHYVKFPGFENVPAGLGAVTTSPGTVGFAALFAAAGFLELVAWTEDPSKEPGNFGDPLGLNQYNQEMRERELNNGRMGMFAAIGIIAAELCTGKDAIQQFGL